MDRFHINQSIDGVKEAMIPAVAKYALLVYVTVLPSLALNSRVCNLLSTAFLGL